MSIQCKIIRGEELKNYLSELARLRIQVFREYPYLYDGTEEYENKYLQTYIASGNAMAVLAFDGEQVIGASTGVPMADETIEFKQPFIDRDMDPEAIFYCGESVLLPRFRGRGIYKKFFTERENFAKQLGGMTHSCFCGVVRPNDHSLKPENYQPLDEVWKHFGYEPREDLITIYKWKDIDENEESEHPMMYWIKPLNG